MYDIRKEILEYAKNPKNFINLIEQANKKSDSPFKLEVFKYLITKGFHI